MILMNYEGKPGGVKDYIDTLSDPIQKEMAYAEYCYFSGDHETTASIMSKYLECDNPVAKVFAWLFYSFSNLTLCKPEEVKRGIAFIYSVLKSGEDKTLGPEMQAMFILVANAGNVLLDLQMEGVPPLNEYIGYLPDGLRMLGCYIMANQAYLDGDYGKGLGIVETSLSLQGKRNLIPYIYINLVGAMNAMSLGNVKQGKEYFKQAYQSAVPDQLFEPIGEHHGLLQGLVETCLRKTDKDNYEKIIGITYRFSYGWRCIHNPITNENIADTLTTTEFTVAMLANRGWTNTEIAAYMDLSVNTIKVHISNVFTKLDITSRKELKNYMLK